MAGEADEIVESLGVEVAFDEMEGLKGCGVGDVSLQEQGVELSRRVDVGAGDGQVDEGWMEEDDGIVAEKVEGAIIVDEVEGAGEEIWEEFGVGLAGFEEYSIVRLLLRDPGETVFWQK